MMEKHIASVLFGLAFLFFCLMPVALSKQKKAVFFWLLILTWVTANVGSALWTHVHGNLTVVRVNLALALIIPPIDYIVLRRALLRKNGQ